MTETNTETTEKPVEETPKVTEERPKEETTSTPKTETKEAPKEDTKGALSVDEFGKLMNQFAELTGKPKESPKLETVKVTEEKPKEETKEETPKVNPEDKPLIDPKVALDTLIKVYKVPEELAHTVRLMTPKNAAQYLNSEAYTKFLEKLEAPKANTEKRGTEAPKDTEKVAPKKTFKDLTKDYVGDAFKDCVK